MGSLKDLHAAAAPLQRPPASAPKPYEVPVELLRYVDDGGNPDMFIRDVIRGVVEANQGSKGKVEAFR